VAAGGEEEREEDTRSDSGEIHEARISPGDLTPTPLLKERGFELEEFVFPFSF